MSLKIIGTSHIAEESVKKLAAEIEKQRPDIVAIELDKQRFDALFAEKRKPVFSDIKYLGIMGFIFARIGGDLQDALGEKVGLKPGDDMRAAVRSARIVKAKLALIDQPIKITLRNLSVKVPFREKLSFIGLLIGGALFPSRFGKLKKKIDLRKVPSQKLIDEVIEELKNKLPNFYNVLISDRNKHMAKALRSLAKKFPNENIFAVVGAGHEKDLKKILRC